MKFVQLILRRIVKIVATKCQILRIKCTKIDFGWGSAPDPLGELTALPQTPRSISGALLLREEYIGRERNGEEGGEGRGREGRGRSGGEGKGRKKWRGGDPVCIFKFSFITYAEL